MLSAIRCIAVSLSAGRVLIAVPLLSTAQEAGSGPILAAAGEFPEAPQPQFAVASAEPAEAQTLSGRNQGARQQAPASAPVQNGNAQTGTQNSSSAQTAATQSDTEKSEHEKAEEQLKEQEHQRVAGVMATFNTTSNRNALPLSPGQKFQLFFRSEIDPWPFLLAGAVSGIGQADDSYPEWGQGAQGYAKRFGAAYSDAFIGNFFGNAVLPIVLHEDPGTSRKARAAKRDAFYGRRRARSGASATKADGGRTMPMSEAT